MAKDEEGTLADVLQIINGGEFHHEATEELKKLVMAIRSAAENGGKAKGKLGVTIEFTLDRGIMELTAKLNVAAPALVRMKTIMYDKPDGTLHRNDPRQYGLGLAAGPVRDVSTPDVRDIRMAQASSNS